WLHGQGLLPEVTLPAGEKEVIHFDGYAGPKEYERLTTIDRGLESIMRLDLFMFFRANWMSWISKSILRSLIFFRNIFPFPGGYGIAIIIVTIIIKLIFWPLTHKSTVSMRRMQKLQPLIKEIREKYKDDAQKMNRKVMELYREHKVNPLGGCLPILFQIPVFFALFNTLRGAIELRQASFLWVADLSMPDTLDWMPLGLPLRPLAILMAGTMFLQQKMSPSSSDPTQKRMMYFMTMFFMFIFYTMPAGLTLYWTTNQILTIIQNLFISKKESSEEKGK
ncbi:MAG: membrane protein insertase YidC, partial [Verrucomicrobiota bacterium]